MAVGSLDVGADADQSIPYYVIMYDMNVLRDEISVANFIPTCSLMYENAYLDDGVLSFVVVPVRASGYSECWSTFSSPSIPRHFFPINLVVMTL